MHILGEHKERERMTSIFCQEQQSLTISFFVVVVVKAMHIVEIYTPVTTVLYDAEDERKYKPILSINTSVGGATKALIPSPFLCYTVNAMGSQVLDDSSQFVSESQIPSLNTRPSLMHLELPTGCFEYSTGSILIPQYPPSFAGSGEQLRHLVMRERYFE